MSDPILNSPNAIAPLNSATPVTTEVEWSDAYDLEQQHLGILSRELRRIYTWFGFLAGSSLLLIVTLSGLAVWLKMEQQQLERQLLSLTATKAEIERVKNLETQVNLLNQKVPEGLSSQLKGLQDQLKTLRTRTEEINTQAVASEQANENFLKALKEISHSRKSNLEPSGY